MGQCCSNDDHAPDNFGINNRSTHQKSAKARSSGTVSSQPAGRNGRHEIFRFFMVGMGSAGKSTVIKQLQKLCHDRPDIYKMFDSDWRPINPNFATHEKERYRRIIRRNVFDAIAVLEQYVQEWSLRPSSSSAADVVLRVASGLSGPDDLNFDKNLIDALMELIQDPAIQKALDRRAEMLGTHQLADGALHYLKHSKMTEIFDEVYVPNEDDIVHSRSPTTGIQDYRFGIRDMWLQIHDIGGQKVERGKLLSYINNWVSADRSGYRNFILYVISMAEYNIPHPEHAGITLMDESVMMLQNILELQPIQNCGLLLFFNKDDVFRQKIAQCATNESLRADTLRIFEGYVKEKSEITHKIGQSAIAKKFTKAMAEVKSKRYKGIYHKFTCAIDSKMMSSIFTTIENEIINHTLDTGAFLFS